MKLTVIMCLILEALVSNAGGSETVWKFVNYIRGEYDNKIQTQQPGDKHPYTQVRILPVDLNCFKKQTVMFGEYAAKGVIQELVLAVVTVVKQNTITLDVYTIANKNDYKPGELTVEKLSKMPCAAFHREENCTASYTVAKGYIVGSFPICSYTTDCGKHPRFKEVHGCDSVTVKMPKIKDQDSSTEPFEFLYTTPKSQAINSPEGYPSPCAKN